MKDWVKQWPRIDFWRFYRIFTLKITSRSFHLKKVKVLIVFGNSDPFLITSWGILKRAFYQNHISLSINTCVNSMERALCASTWRISQSNGASNFGFGVVTSLGICINLICIWEKSPKQSLVLVNQLFSPENLKNSYCYMFFDNFFTSPNLMPKLFKDGIYATGTVRSNRKHRPTLQVDKQMKRGEHDWSACDTISATKWMDNRSVILLSNYHNPSVVQEINRRVKGSKEKVSITRTWEE